jgi:hypothetical protein
MEIKAVAVVAHPDDCVIFARPFIESYPQFNWSILYLTYSENDDRAKEVSQYWNEKNISTSFLGFKDDYKDLESNQLNFWSLGEVEAQIQSALHDAQLVLTHNEDGEYGHPHHQAVHYAVQSLSVPQVYFANEGNKTDKIEITSKLDLKKFPIHKDVISEFKELNIGRYIVTSAAREIINENINTR